MRKRAEAGSAVARLEASSMRHARPNDLKSIASLLDDLRKLPGLKERTLGSFYRGPKGFLHFHEDAGNLFADLKIGDAFERFPATTISDRKALLANARRALNAKSSKR